ncbi:MAG: hypothetical protein OMM_07095 [Candidatus Magnetoglobus multicellularis str. Araruama]|uniref:Uncharacterized protein n=1 Tax=Candidatus Magnetoglobus multicellularis str. Araruama TaxID=890399 RepID=A0A1V1PEF3_9BACT|nr:MAG: hypothetical protein OMM_07095 [Candidatus Magnetoglobus multicellularis str. Araruama]
MAKGDYSIRFDADRLRNMISEGKTAKEIMKACKISNYTLREHLVLLQEKDRKIYVIEGLFDDRQVTDKKPIPKEGVIFSNKMLENTEFKSGDAFEMIVEEEQIILKKIPNDE